MKSRMKNYPTSLSTPIDRTAARVVSKGEHYVQQKKEHVTAETWENPPATLPVPSVIAEWVGTRHDRMTIVGYLGQHNRNGYKWLARCTCGKYEVRNHANWRKPRDKYIDMCDPCKSYQSKMRSFEREKHFKLTGSWPED